MLQQFTDSQDVDALHFTAWSCALVPDAVADYSVPVRLAQSTVAQESTELSHRRQALGAILFRAGRFDDALKQLNPLATAESIGKTSIAYRQYFLAMTHYKLGNEQEAVRWLKQAIKAHEQEFDEATGDGVPGAGLGWNRRLTLLLLRREAEALINGNGRRRSQVPIGTAPVVAPTPEN